MAEALATLKARALIGPEVPLAACISSAVNKICVRASLKLVE